MRILKPLLRTNAVSRLKTHRYAFVKQKWKCIMHWHMRMQRRWQYCGWKLSMLVSLIGLEFFVLSICYLFPLLLVPFVICSFYTSTIHWYTCTLTYQLNWVCSYSQSSFHFASVWGPSSNRSFNLSWYVWPGVPSYSLYKLKKDKN
jgi:hypothetical protein